MQYWMFYEWVDYRLTWNESDFGNLSRIMLHASKIWIPELLLNNNAKLADDNEITPQSNYVNVFYDGSCFWQPRYEKSVTQCPVDVTWFPFDEQVCDLAFESWVMDRFSMNLVTNSSALDLESFLQPDGWLLRESKTTRGFTHDAYPTVTFRLHFRRKPLYYVVNLMVPCCLLSFIAVVTFLLQPSCNERLELSVTILLAMSVYQIIVSNKLPSTSENVPVIVGYFLFIICVCVLATAVTVVVVHLYQRAETHPLTAMPAWMRNLFCKRLAACLCMKQPSSPPLEPPLIRRNKHSVSLGDGISNRSLHDNGAIPSSPTSEDDSMKDLLKEIRDLLKTRVLTEQEQRYEDNRENKMKKDWMLAAAVLDRISAVAFAIILVVGTLVFFILFSTHRSLVTF